MIGELLQEPRIRPPHGVRVRLFASAIRRLAAIRSRDESPVTDLYLPLPRWKRTMDIIGAILGLILSVPLLICIAIVVKLTSRGPVLFLQTRAGLNGKPFTMLKIRTMVHDADERKSELLQFNERDGPAFKLSRDPRITRFGKILRRTSLDELPQFWNVLKGDMSLVGPRPLPLNESAACDFRQRLRLAAMPGITCIWQITARSGRSFESWLRMDLQYINTRTPLRDLLILILTIPAIIFRGGAS